MIESTRDRQLSWFPPGSIILQDQELINFIQSTGSTHAIGHGSVAYFAPFIQFVDTGPVDLYIMIQTGSVDFDNMLSILNDTIQEHVRPNGRIYVAVNKYQIQPKRYATDLPDDFDAAIGQYFNRKIKARVDQYVSCGQDNGLRFNWVHPLSRFYLTKTHDS